MSQPTVRWLVTFIVAICVLLTASLTEAQSPPITVTRTVSGGPGDWTLTFSVTNNLPEGFEIYGFSVADIAYGIVGSPASWDQSPFIPTTFSTGLFGYTGPTFTINNSWCVFGSCFVSMQNNGTTITGFQIHSTEEVAPINLTYVVTALNLTNSNPPAPGCLNCGSNPIYVIPPPIKVTESVSGAPGDWTLTFSVTNNLPQGFDIYAFGVADIGYGIVGSPASWDEHPDIPFTFSTGLFGYTGPSFPINNSWCVFGSCFVSIPNNGTTITGFQIHSTEEVAPANRTYVIAALNVTNNNPPAPGCVNCGFNPVYVLFNRVNQATLVVNAPASLTYGTTATLSGDGGSGTGALTFSAGTSTGCAVSGNQLSVTNASGTCRVTAAKASDNNYNAIESAPATVTLNKASQVITFGPLVNVKVSESPITVAATASSALGVTFGVTTPAVCVPDGANGQIITLLASGTCIVVARQTGDANYLAAADVPQSFTIGNGKTDQTITFAIVTDKTLAQSPFNVSAVASSGLLVTFTTTTTEVCTAGGPRGVAISLLTAGVCTVRADQGGNAAYNPAPSVTQTFTVTKAEQVIMFAELSDRPLSASPFVVSASATSGRSVKFTSETPAVCTASKKDGATVTLLGFGTCTLKADQAGDAVYNPAPSVSRNFNVF